MKLRCLFPNFYSHVSGRDLYISTMGLIWNLYFPVLRDITLGSIAGAERRAEHFPVLFNDPRVHINDQHTNFQFGILRIINGNN